MTDGLPIRIMDFRGTYKGGGGPDKTILLSAARHDKNRFHILVTYLRNPKDGEFQIRERALKLGLNYADVKDAKLFDPACIWKLNRMVRSNRIQILHAHDDKTLLYAWVLKKLNRRLKIIYTCHSHPVFRREDFQKKRDYLAATIRKKIRLFLMKRYHHPIIAVSMATQRYLADDGIDEVVVLYNGIDTAFWQRKSGAPVLRREFGIDDQGLLVGTVARLAPEKDIATFLRVAQKVRASMPAARFVVVGDGPGNELARSREMSDTMGMGDFVYFTGHRNDLLDVYSSLDVFLMTSVYENMPNTILEAMAMETPIVSTSVGGVPEMLEDGRHGLLCPIRDVNCLAQAVSTLLENRALGLRLSKAARERAEEVFSFTARLHKMERLYARVYCPMLPTLNSEGANIGR